MTDKNVEGRGLLQINLKKKLALNSKLSFRKILNNLKIKLLLNRLNKVTKIENFLKHNFWFLLCGKGVNVNIFV